MRSKEAEYKMKVPFVDLRTQYDSFRPSVDEAIQNVLNETAFISGKYASEFERSFAEYIGVRHCIAVANGTDAIEIGLQAIGIKPGDEVLVPANTWISTAEAVTSVGAVPVFVDIDPATYNIDPEAISSKLTPKTAAIIPVHLYGLPADMDAIVAIARENGLKILEDCAQAHGAKYKGKVVGNFGDVATFSFYPSKNLGAFGDAGGIVTNDETTAAAARLIANHGQSGKNVHTIEGRNSRMDGIQAAVLSIKLPLLDGWIAARRRNAAAYDRLLRDLPVGLPSEPEGSTHTYHLYVVQVDERDRLQAELSNAGIETGIHYPTSLPFMKAYSRFGHRPEDFPVSFEQMGRIISLPMYPELTEEMIEYVCRSIAVAVA